MKWDIYDSATGCMVATFTAKTAREALLKYLMGHEELDDMMIWKSTDRAESWRLAPYDKEEEFLYARAKIEEERVWSLFIKLPRSADMRLVDKEGKVLAESYGSLMKDDFDDATVVSVKPDPDNSDMYTVVIDMEESL